MQPKFIEVHSANTRKPFLVNLMFLVSVDEYQLSLKCGSGYQIIPVMESYEELKRKIYT